MTNRMAIATYFDGEKSPMNISTRHGITRSPKPEAQKRGKLVNGVGCKPKVHFGEGYYVAKKKNDHFGKRPTPSKNGSSS